MKSYSFASSFDGNGKHISHQSLEIYTAYILHIKSKVDKKKDNECQCKEGLLQSLCELVPQLASPGLGDTLSGPMASPVLHDEGA